HGLRASELCSLLWEQVDLAHARLHVSRLKSGIPSVHPLTGSELRALRRLQREQELSRYLFLSVPRMLSRVDEGDEPALTHTILVVPTAARLLTPLQAAQALFMQR